MTASMIALGADAVGPSVLSGIRVWDGRHDLGTCDLSWDGDAIVAVLPAGSGAPGVHPDTRSGAGTAGGTGAGFGGGGLVVVPGLVDTHVHLLGFAGGRENAKGFDTFSWPLVTIREEQTLHAAANAQRALAAGVTTLRDLGSDEAQAGLARVFDGGILPGPRLLAYGPVGMTAGHLDLFTPRAVRDRPPTADGVDACRALVRRWARAGLTGIKIYTSG